jgi:hypothetical protein
MTMVESIENEPPLESAREELKRADHLIYVSLKYTRTVDVIKSIIQRLINALDFGILALYEHAKKQKRVTVIPELPRLRAEGIKTIYTDPVIRQYMDFYVLLRKIDKAKFERAMEYRRHVTMTAFMDSEKVEVTIDIIGDYFQKAKDFILFVNQTIYGLPPEGGA